MKTEMENPGAGATASGADREKAVQKPSTWRRSDQPNALGASGMRAAPEGFSHRQWERRVLSALRASRREGDPKGKMGFLVTAVAMDWAGWADREGVFFRSAQDTADAIGAAVSNVRDAIKMLIDAGLAEVPVGTKKQTSKRAKGRDATTYRLLMADNFHLHGGNNSDGISAPTGANNSEAFSAPTGAGFSAPTGAPIIEGTLEGAGARVNAPPARISNTDVVLFEEDHDEVEKDVGARERAPVIQAVAGKIDPSDPDAWRADPDFSTGAAAKSQIECKGAGCAPKGAPAPDPAPDDEQDDERGGPEIVAPAHPQPDLDTLAMLIEDIHSSASCDAPHKFGAEEFVREWRRGYVLGVPSARMATAGDTSQVIIELKRLAIIDPEEFLSVEEYSRRHLHAVGKIAAKATADADSAARAVELYERDVAARVARAQARKEVAHG